MKLTTAKLKFVGNYWCSSHSSVSRLKTSVLCDRELREYVELPPNEKIDHLIMTIFDKPGKDRVPVRKWASYRVRTENGGDHSTTIAFAGMLPYRKWVYVRIEYVEK